jgi:hypothetical protein
MTQDIIEMARQAGATEIGHKPPAFHFYLVNLESFAKLAAEAEREDCAKLCDDPHTFGPEGEWCAFAIRARGVE